MTDARLLPTPAQPRRSTRVAPVVLIDVDECPRCGRRHHGLELRRLRQPSGAFVVDGVRVRLVSWSTCPETGEPITHAEIAP